MSIVFLAKGTATMGMTKTDKDGEVTHWMPLPERPEEG